MKPIAKTPQRRKSKPVITRYSRWIRLYSSLRHDPKIVRLGDLHFRTWITVLLVAGEHPEGILPSIDDLACELRCAPPRAEQLIGDLIDWGLVDIVSRTGDGPILQPHNWNARQFQSDNSTERSRKHREKHQNTVQRCSNGDATDLQRPRSDSVSAGERVFPSDSDSETNTNTALDDADWLPDDYPPSHGNDMDGIPE